MLLGAVKRLSHWSDMNIQALHGHGSPYDGSNDVECEQGKVDLVTISERKLLVCFLTLPSYPHQSWKPMNTWIACAYVSGMIGISTRPVLAPTIAVSAPSGRPPRPVVFGRYHASVCVTQTVRGS